MEDGGREDGGREERRREARETRETRRAAHKKLKGLKKVLADPGRDGKKLRSGE
jgi:hypothetical protein